MDPFPKEMGLSFPSPLVRGCDPGRLRDTYHFDADSDPCADCPARTFARSFCDLSDQATAARRRPDVLQSWQCRCSTLLREPVAGELRALRLFDAPTAGCSAEASAGADHAVHKWLPVHHASSSDDLPSSRAESLLRRHMGQSGLWEDPSGIIRFPGLLSAGHAASESGIPAGRSPVLGLLCVQKPGGRLACGVEPDPGGVYRGKLSLRVAYDSSFLSGKIVLAPVPKRNAQPCFFVMITCGDYHGNVSSN